MSDAALNLDKDKKELAYIIERGILDNEIVEGVTDNETVWNFIRQHMSMDLKMSLERKLSETWYETVKSTDFNNLIDRRAESHFQLYREKIRRELKCAANLEPLPGFKTTYVTGDRVMVPWMKDTTTKKNWHRATVKCHRVVGHSKYGEIRKYHIIFDEGDHDPDLSEEFVWSIDEYRIAEDEEIEASMEEKGVNRYLLAGDPYTEKKGFYKIEKYTGQKIYGSILDALRAHDNAYVERHDPSSIQKKDLLLPNEWEFSTNYVHRYRSYNDVDDDCSSLESESSCSYSTNSYSS